MRRLAPIPILVVCLSGMFGFAEGVSAAPPVAASPPTPTVAADRAMVPMRVLVVREDRPGCGTTCAEWISAEGDFVDRTPLDFQRIFWALGARTLPVLMHSRGGSMEAALEVGRLLRQHHAAVAVARTILPTCLDPDSACREWRGTSLVGRPAETGLCLSACVAALAGGEVRLAGPETVVGVHLVRAPQRVLRETRMRYRRDEDGNRIELGPEPTGESLTIPPYTIAPGDPYYETIARFYREMGLIDGLVPLMESAPPSGIRLVTPRERAALRLTTGPQTVGSLLPGITPARLVGPIEVADPAVPRIYRPIVPVMQWAVAELRLSDGGSVALRFDGIIGARTVNWIVAVDRVRLPARAVGVGFRMVTAERVHRAFALPRPRPAPGEAPAPAVPPAGSMATADFCALARAPMVVLQLLHRAQRHRIQIVRTADRTRLPELEPMRALLCRSVSNVAAVAPAFR
ncbi:hypothetical protein EYW49_04805 [Siculibacillus lacustris]|uniref:Uncharacterized protein n=1 Tax=Siculibacillus lacustris TaxID=1549641 RepID=A0A4Q9VW02_9HYPH|nr:hypothetical protein [Siculibacillus lacustris]TBW39993.1 hypothetical protein EYW49_04805 [Siculibacillus lacustris]